jgi:hypothetical protein
VFSGDGVYHGQAVVFQVGVSCIFWAKLEWCEGILVSVDFFNNWVVDCLLADVTDIVEMGERCRNDAR